jgi:hypothetical protein
MAEHIAARFSGAAATWPRQRGRGGSAEWRPISWLCFEAVEARSKAGFPKLKGAAWRGAALGKAVVAALYWTVGKNHDVA